MIVENNRCKKKQTNKHIKRVYKLFWEKTSGFRFRDNSERVNNFYYILFKRLIVCHKGIKFLKKFFRYRVCVQFKILNVLIKNASQTVSNKCK